MIRLVSFFCVMVALLIPAADGSRDIHGDLQEVNSVRILHLWGTPSEMGYAHGYLMGSAIVKLASEYMFTIVTPENYETVVLPVFRIWLQVPAPYLEEIESMMTGIVDSGADIFVSELNRNLTVEDLAVANCIVDLWGFYKGKTVNACSSICGFGDATLNDPDIPGSTIVCRDMDWGDTNDYLLGRLSMIIAFEPSDPSRQAWFSVGWPGFVACLSGMNTAGTGATLNMGNYDVVPGIAFHKTPIGFQLREGLESADADGDGINTINDIGSVLSGQQQIPSTIIHTFGPGLDPSLPFPPSQVIESNYDGLAIRFPSDDPVLSDFFIAATNHHRVLYDPVSCWRYALIQQLVSEDYKMDTPEAWTIETEVSVQTTVQTMIFRPDLRDILIAFSVDSFPAPYHTQSHLRWEDIFSGNLCEHTGDVDQSGSITPQDALSSFQVYLGIYPEPGSEEICAADCNGSNQVTPEDALCIFEHYLTGSCFCEDPVPPF